MDEPWENLARDLVGEAIDNMERKGVVLKQHSVSNLRVKVRRWLRYRYVIEKPLPQEFIDPIIEERKAA